MTLRARLLISLLAIVVALVVAGTAVAHNQRRFLVEQVDERLAAAVLPAQAMARDQLAPQATPDPYRPGPGPEALSELLVGVVAPDGTVTDLFAPGLSEVEPRLDRLPDDAVRPSRPFAVLKPFTVETTAGAYRVALVSDPSGRQVLVGLSLDRVEAANRRLLLGAALAALAVVAVTALAGWWVVHLGLRPIRHMTEAADAIARGELDRRVDHPSPRTEAGRLGRAFNVMLDERQGSEQRLRRFVADASHELRTPLTSIRGYVELYRKGGLRAEGELDDAMRRIAGEGSRMGSLVEDLLLLARLDEGRPLARERVDLAELVRDACADIAALHPRRRIDTDVDAELPVLGDEARLRQVVGAVLTNAVVHTAPDAAIEIRARRHDGTALLEVCDHGEGMRAEVAEHAFERFFRGDPARSRHKGGSGLGLSIVRSVVDAHGGRARLVSEPNRGTTVHIEVPAAPLP